MPDKLTLTDILYYVSDTYGVSVSDIKSQRRFKPVTHARHVYCWLARHHTPRSYPQIAREIGYRDHTTAIHSVRKIDGLIADGKLAAPQPPRFGIPRKRLLDQIIISPETVKRILAESKITVPPLHAKPAPPPKKPTVKRRYRPTPIIWRDSHHNVTAALMGDPPPGRSALELEAAE